MNTESEAQPGALADSPDAPIDTENDTEGTKNAPEAQKSDTEADKTVNNADASTVSDAIEKASGGGTDELQTAVDNSGARLADQDAKPDPDPDGADAAKENFGGEAGELPPTHEIRVATGRAINPDADVPAQTVIVEGIDDANQVSIVQYDGNNRITRVSRVSKGTRYQYSLMPGQRVMLVACSPKSHEEILENYGFDQSIGQPE